MRCPSAKGGMAMGIERALAFSAEYANPEKFDSFRKHLDPLWIEQALEATGTATIRRRRLPADQVVWVVLAMALFRDESIESVVSKLDLAIGGQAMTTVSKSSIAKARARLGKEPMQWLFERCSEVWAKRSAEAHRFDGLEVYGIDGSTLRVADSEENRSAFGGQSGRGGTESGYPLVRVVTLMVLRSHLLRAVSFTPYRDTSELHDAVPLCAHLPDRSLVILDRAYLCAPLLLALQHDETERHWLTRARSSTKYRVLENFGDGDELVEMNVSSEARRDEPSLPKTWIARAVRYQRPGHPARVLLTSLRDPKRYPAQEIAALYHERWELELGYDELKTELLEAEETIRSQRPEGVYQELWGIVLAYNMIRVEIERVAAEARVPPTRISFVESLRLVRIEWSWLSVVSPGTIPKRLAKLRANIKRYLLPARRERTYPRAVKRKMSNYDRKRPRVEIAN